MEIYTSLPKSQHSRGDLHITPNKRYKVRHQPNHGEKAGVILNDIGEALFIIFDKSCHLRGEGWES